MFISSIVYIMYIRYIWHSGMGIYLLLCLVLLAYSIVSYNNSCSRYTSIALVSGSVTTYHDPPQYLAIMTQVGL